MLKVNSIANIIHSYLHDYRTNLSVSKTSTGPAITISCVSVKLYTYLCILYTYVVNNFKNTLYWMWLLTGKWLLSQVHGISQLHSTNLPTVYSILNLWHVILIIYKKSVVITQLYIHICKHVFVITIIEIYTSPFKLFFILLYILTTSTYVHTYIIYGTYSI